MVVWDLKKERIFAKHLFQFDSGTRKSNFNFHSKFGLISQFYPLISPRKLEIMLFSLKFLLSKTFLLFLFQNLKCNEYTKISKFLSIGFTAFNKRNEKRAYCINFEPGQFHFPSMTFTSIDNMIK